MSVGIASHQTEVSAAPSEATEKIPSQSFELKVGSAVNVCGRRLEMIKSIGSREWLKVTGVFVPVRNNTLVLEADRGYPRAVYRMAIPSRKASEVRFDLQK